MNALVMNALVIRCAGAFCDEVQHTNCNIFKFQFSLSEICSCLEAQREVTNKGSEDSHKVCDDDRSTISWLG